MQPNYRIVLSPTTGVSGAPLISCCQADCATKPALKWGSSNSNELWSAVWLQLYFPFSTCFAYKSMSRFSVHLVFALSSVNDISCSGSHCAAKLTSRWSLMYPQELYFFPIFALQTCVLTLALVWQAHAEISAVRCVSSAHASGHTRNVISTCLKCW